MTLCQFCDNRHTKTLHTIQLSAEVSCSCHNSKTHLWVLTNNNTPVSQCLGILMFKKTFISDLYPTAMRYTSVSLVILCCSSFVTEAIREELNIAEINPQDIKSQALLTSGVHLGDFPLPSYLKELTFLNFMF